MAEHTRARQDTTTSPVRPTSPFELVGLAWSRRKWLGILTFLPLATATVCVVAFLPHLYQSTAVVLVERQQVPEEFVRSTVTSVLETRLQSINQEILSRSRLEQLINRFGLYPELRKRVSPEEVIERMRQDIQLELRGADVKGGERRATIAFSLSYRGSEPQTVAQVTNTLASSYIEENLRVRERQAAGTADFLRVQLDQIKVKLDQQEKQVSEFKKRHVGELPQELEVNLATLERLNTQLRLNGDNQGRALERREAMVRQIAELTPPPSRGEAPTAALPPEAAVVPALAAPAAPVDPTALRLARLRQELAELKTRFSDKYPDVIRTRAEIADAEKELADRKAHEAREALEAPAPSVPGARPGPVVAAVPPGPGPLDTYLFRARQSLAEVEAEVRVLKAEEARLRAAIQGYQQRVQDTPIREQQYKELARDYDATKELYTSLLKRLSESQLAESMEQRQKGEQFRLIEPALAAERPIAPDRRRLLGTGLALAFGAAVGLVFLTERLQAGFHTLDDLRSFTNVPVLASIPRIVTTGDTRRRRRRARFVTAGAVLGLVLVAGGAVWAARGNERLTALLAGRPS